MESISQEEFIVVKKQLKQAAREGNITVVEKILSQGFNINSVIEDDEDNSALHVASSRGHEKLVTFLLKKGAEINQMNNDGLTSLQLAVLNQQTEIALLLLEEGADPNLTSNEGKTPLHSVRSTIVAYKLLDCGAEVNSKTNCGETPLHIASFYLRIQIIFVLLEMGAEVDATTEDGITPLMCACDLFYGSDPEVVNLLIRKGAAINAQDNNGGTALHKASSTGKSNLIKLLLKKGAQINAQNNLGHTALFLAVLYRHRETISLLLEGGADPNIAVNNPCDFPTPLDLACSNNSKHIVYNLIDYGANVNAESCCGSTVLNKAHISGNVEIVNALLRTGDASGSNITMTPLIHATVNDNIEVVDSLIHRGAVIDRQDGYGYTALFWSSSIRMVETLLNLGASIDIKNKDGKTFYDTCLELEDKNRFGSRDKVLNTIVEHVAKLKLAKLPVNVDISAKYEFDWYKIIQNQCKDELQKISNVNIEGFSLSKVFSNYSQPFYLKCQQLYKKLEKFLFSGKAHEFPQYVHILRNTFKSSKVRYELLEEAADSLSSEKRQEWCRKLPYEVRVEILSYLSNEDLKSLINSAESEQRETSNYNK